MKKYLGEPVILVFFAVAALFVLGAVGLGWQQHRVDAWPRVVVEVISSEVTLNQYNTYQGEVRVRLAGGGEKLLVTSWSSVKAEEIRAQLESLPAGAAVGVPQNPENKEELQLPPDPSQAWLPWALAGGGLLFALVPVGVVALSERKDAVRICGLVFVGCGCLMFGVGAWMVWGKVQVIQSWPEVEATVVESRVGLRPGRRRPLRGIDSVMTYQVDGKEIKALVASRAGTSDFAWVEQQVAGTYAPGTKHRIRYRKTAPQDATFEAAWSLAYFWEGLLSAGLGLMTAGLGAAVAKFLK
jgi:hypothetical protein